MITLTDAQRDTLHTMLSEWSLHDVDEPDEFADLRERARVKGPLVVTREECALVLKTFTPYALDVWRRGGCTHEQHRGRGEGMKGLTDALRRANAE